MTTYSCTKKQTIKIIELMKSAEMAILMKIVEKIRTSDIRKKEITRFK